MAETVTELPAQGVNQRGILDDGCGHGRPSFGQRHPCGELASLQARLRGEDASSDSDVEQQVSGLNILGRAKGLRQDFEHGVVEVGAQLGQEVRRCRMRLRITFL